MYLIRYINKEGFYAYHEENDWQMVLKIVERLLVDGSNKTERCEEILIFEVAKRLTPRLMAEVAAEEEMR